MQTRLFQNTLVQLKKDVQRTLGVIDDTGAVTACSDEPKIGVMKENVLSAMDGASEPKVIGNYTYKRIETYNKAEYIVFCEGTDQIAQGYCRFLGTHFLTMKQYYDEKYDKASFIKNIIVDNILPSDVLYRSKELHLSIDVPRVVMIVRLQKTIDTAAIDVLRGMFPERGHDFVVRLDDYDAAVVKEITKETEAKELVNIAKTIVDTMNAEAMVKASIGLSTVVDTIQELSRAYREARIALEVGKVFDTEKNIISYDNLGIGRLIYQLPTTLCHLFLDEVFKKGSIDVLDTETIYTIQKFFENNLNVSETSRKLFVHRNTLVYRLDKIKKLTGLDLREFDDAIVFKVAMMVNKYLTSEPTRL